MLRNTGRPGTAMTLEISKHITVHPAMGPDKVKETVSAPPPTFGANQASTALPSPDVFPVAAEAIGSQALFWVSDTEVIVLTPPSVFAPPLSITTSNILPAVVGGITCEPLLNAPEFKTV